MRIVNGFMALAFFASLWLQLNDPDPWVWTGVYGLAAATCIAWERNWMAPIVHNAIIASAMVGCLWLYTQVPPDFSMEHLGSTWAMNDSAEEVIREAGGSTIIALWILLLRIFPRPTTADTNED